MRVNLRARKGHGFRSHNLLALHAWGQLVNVRLHGRKSPLYALLESGKGHGFLKQTFNAFVNATQTHFNHLAVALKAAHFARHESFGFHSSFLCLHRFQGIGVELNHTIRHVGDGALYSAPFLVFLLQGFQLFLKLHNLVGEFFLANFGFTPHPLKFLPLLAVNAVHDHSLNFPDSGNGDRPPFLGIRPRQNRELLMGFVLPPHNIPLI